MRAWGRGLATLLVLAGPVAAATDHPRKAKTKPHHDDKPHWELPLPVAQKPTDSKPLFGDRSGDQGPPDRSLHFGTVTVTPGGFLSLDTGRAHD